MRADLYTLIHKVQRFHLFQLSIELGLADLKDINAVGRVATQMRRMIDHLRDHAKNEENYINPLFKKIGVGAASHLEREHRELEEEIGKLEKTLDEERWDDLYGQYSRFLGVYLTHLSEEELAQKEILWARYDDPELMAVFNRFKAERSPQAAKADLELMLPVLSIPELTRIFSGMKASVPPQAFQGACELAAQVLGHERWQGLRAKIA